MGIIIRYGVIIGSSNNIEAFNERKNKILEMSASKTYSVLDEVDMSFVSYQQAVDYIARVNSDDTISEIFRFSLRG